MKRPLIPFIASAALMLAGCASTSVAGTPTAAPIPVTVKDGVVKVGNPTAKATIAIYEDLQCPVCKTFETRTGETLDKLIKSGRAAVEYHVVAFLDRASSTRYSSRAANADACLAAATPQAWPQWHTLIFRHQPEEETAGLPDSRLIELGKQAGVESREFATCVTGEKNKDAIRTRTKTIIADGLQGTPTVKVNGTEVKATSKAITAAVNGK